MFGGPSILALATASFQARWMTGLAFSIRSPLVFATPRFSVERRTCTSTATGMISIRSMAASPGFAIIRTHIGAIFLPRSIGNRERPKLSVLLSSSSNSCASPAPSSIVLRTAEWSADARLRAMACQASASGLRRWLTPLSNNAGSSRQRPPASTSIRQPVRFATPRRDDRRRNRRQSSQPAEGGPPRQGGVSSFSSLSVATCSRQILNRNRSRQAGGLAGSVPQSVIRIPRRGLLPDAGDPAVAPAGCYCRHQTWRLS